MTENDLQILARTLFGEARGEGDEGLEAVACVIMNRFKANKWYTGYEIHNGKKVPSVAQAFKYKNRTAQPVYNLSFADFIIS